MSSPVKPLTDGVSLVTEPPALNQSSPPHHDHVLAHGGHEAHGLILDAVADGHYGRDSRSPASSMKLTVEPRG
jgi:hypothetical protein